MSIEEAERWADLWERLGLTTVVLIATFVLLIWSGRWLGSKILLPNTEALRLFLLTVAQELPKQSDALDSIAGRLTAIENKVSNVGRRN